MWRAAALLANDTRCQWWWLRRCCRLATPLRLSRKAAGGPHVPQPGMQLAVQQAHLQGMACTAEPSRMGLAIKAAAVRHGGGPAVAPHGSLLDGGDEHLRLYSNSLLIVVAVADQRSSVCRYQGRTSRMAML